MKNKTVEKIFNDLDRYRDWCRLEYKRFDEAALYNSADRNWCKYMEDTAKAKRRARKR